MTSCSWEALVTQRNRLVVLLLLTVAMFLGSFTVPTLAQDRIPLFVTQTESAFNRQGELKIRNTQIIGVRSDGSTVLSQSVPKPGNRGVAELRTVIDLVKAEEIAVDGLTESLSTVPLSRQRILAHKRVPNCTSDDPKARSSLLGYEVVRVVEERVRPKTTLRIEQWLAPALNCFPLKQVFSVGATAAELYVANVKEVTQVTLSEPPSNLFETPPGYTERQPSQRRTEFARRYPEVAIADDLRAADRQDDEIYHRRQADRGK